MCTVKTDVRSERSPLDSASLNSYSVPEKNDSAGKEPASVHQVTSPDLALGKDLLVYAGLVGFGVFYNRIVAYTNRKYGQHGYTSLLVVFGVFVTLAALSTRLGAINTLKITAGFVASGLPMILGDTSRYLEYKQEVAVALARASKARRKGLNDVGQTQTGERQGFTFHQERN